MAKLTLKKGVTSKIVHVFIQDSSSTVGAGLTGLTNVSASLVAYYIRPGDTGATAITLASETLGTWTSGGFKEVSSANMPGVYELGLPDAVLATGANQAVVMLKGATNMAPIVLEIQLVDYDPNDGVHLGITGIPNAAAGASGGLLISGSNAGTTTLGALTVTGATTLTGNVSAAAGVTITQSTGNGVGLSITGNGSGAGISCTGGATGAGAKFIGGGTSGDGIDITTTSGDGLSITPTAGNAIVATANGTSKHGAVITGGTAGTSDGLKCVAGTGGVDLRAAITGNFTGNISGSVGSVTGAVGSVTGNVGGSVASVTARVTANTDQWAGGTIPAPNVIGVPLIDLKYTLGTISPATAGYVALDWGQVTNKTTVNALTGTTISTSQVAASVTAGVTVTTNNDKTGYSLTQTFPTNFSSLAITAGGAVTVGTNSDKTGYSIAAGGIINGAHAAAEINNLADGYLDRIMSVGVDSGADDTTHRTVRQALRVLRNKVGISAGVLTVYKEDDATASWTGAIATTAGNPISQVDPT